MVSLAEEAGVDLWSIVDAIRVRKTHSNLMYPGIGVEVIVLLKIHFLLVGHVKSFSVLMMILLRVLEVFQLMTKCQLVCISKNEKFSDQYTI